MQACGMCVCGMYTACDVCVCGVHTWGSMCTCASGHVVKMQQIVSDIFQIQKTYISFKGQGILTDFRKRTSPVWFESAPLRRQQVFLVWSECLGYNWVLYASEQGNLNFRILLAGLGHCCLPWVLYSRPHPKDSIFSFSSPSTEAWWMAKAKDKWEGEPVLQPSATLMWGRGSHNQASDLCLR